MKASRLLALRLLYLVEFGCYDSAGQGASATDSAIPTKRSRVASAIALNVLGPRKHRNRSRVNYDVQDLDEATRLLENLLLFMNSVTIMALALFNTYRF